MKECAVRPSGYGRTVYVKQVPMLICPECGAENPADASNCQRCNTVLRGGANRLQWVLVGFLAVTVAGLGAWRLGVFDKQAVVIPEPVGEMAARAGERLIPASAVADGDGVHLELPGDHWKVNTKDSPDKVLKNPAAEFEFVDTQSLAYGILIVEESPLSLDAYVDLALSQSKTRYAGYQLGADQKTTLGGEPARYIEFQVESSEKITFKYFVYYVVRAGKGYQLVFYTIPSLVNDLKSDLAYVREHFKFAD